LLSQAIWILGLFFIALVVLFGLIQRFVGLKRVTVFEYQRGLKYSKGRYIGTLPPGQYWVLTNVTVIAPVDVRPEFVTILGQDVLSADGVTVKISLAAQFEVVDPHVAVNKNVNYRGALYLLLQMALREVVGKEKIDDLMQNRSAIGQKLMELTSAKAADYGVKLTLTDIKDMMFPGEMKKAFAQVVKAQKEGQAALERARSETAALRNLANAARMMDDNPNLLQLRALQALADSGSNTLVFGLPNGVLPVSNKKDGRIQEPRNKEAKEEE
jgi:regulator of protease activity HflC (stomatin/prohibitin superfamily)